MSVSSRIASDAAPPPKPIKTLRLVFQGNPPQCPDTAKPSCLKYCPIGQAAWVAMSKLDKTDTANLHGGYRCQHCNRWVLATSWVEEKPAPLTVQ